MGLFRKQFCLAAVLTFFGFSGLTASKSIDLSEQFVQDLVALEGAKDTKVHKRIYQDFGRNSDTLIQVSNSIIKEVYASEAWLAGVLLQLKSSLLFKQGKVVEAVDAVDSSQAIFLPLDDTRHLARFHLIKGDIYSSIKDLESSYFHLRASKKMYIKVNDSSSIALAFLNLGNTFFYDEKYDSAYFYYNRISHYYKRPESLLSYYQKLNLGNWHLHFKEYKKALEYFRPIEAGLISLNYQYGLSFLYSNMADAFHGVGILDSAILYHRKAVKVCKDQKIGIHFINVSEAIAKTFKEMGHLDSALYYTELQMSLNDSLLNMRINQELKEKEAENQILLHEKDMELMVKRNWGLSIITVLLIGLIIILFMSANKKKLANKALIQTNSELASTQEALKQAWIRNMEKEVAPILRKEKEPQPENEPVPAVSPEKEEKRKVLIQELEAKITEGIYRKNDLTLDSLAKKLKTNRTYLSESINKTYGKNFNSFLNEHRVNEARQVLLNNKKNYTIEAISQMVGFKSISVFNTAFKKQTGLTPSYFEKNAKSQLLEEI